MQVLLLRRRAIFLFDLFPLARERPLAIERLHLFADRFRHVVYLEVFEYMHAQLSRAGQVDVAVVVKVGYNELSTGARGTVDGKVDAGEYDVSGTGGDLHTGRPCCACGALSPRYGVGFRCDKLLFGRQLIGVDNDRIVRSWIGPRMAAIAFASDEFGDAVIVDIDQGEGMRLGK